MSSRRISRRECLRLAGAGAAALVGSQMKVFPSSGRLDRTLKDTMPTVQPMETTPAAPSGSGAAYVPDVEFSITATEKAVQILPGMATRAWGYEGQVLKGPAASLANLPNCSLGPVIRVKTGTRVRLNFHNNLAEESVIHPHGLRVPEDCDGSPMQAIGPGQTKVYDFQVIDPAGPYWFHPHPMLRTAEEVYLGMAGLFYVWDDDEANAIPGASTGANDIPLVIQDRIFDSNNQLVYRPAMMWGMLGSRVLVNDVLDARCGLEPRAYRLRLVNGSNARTYKLAWSNGMPLTVIGTDGGLLPQAVTRSYLTLAPGERADLWADFSALANQQVILKSLAFDAGMGMMGGMGMMSGASYSGGMGMLSSANYGGGMGMAASSSAMGGTGMMSSAASMGMMSGMGTGMGMMGGAGGLPNGAPLDILVVNVGSTAASHPELGPLPPLPVHYDASNVSNFNSPYPVIISMGMMMKWLLNGRQYDPNGVADDEKFMPGVNMAWEFTNLSPIPHPMHLHNARFQVVQRTPPALASYSTVNQGFVESGWKDTTLVWPGEKVKIALQFGPETGMYMYHCHILEHEEMGMMRNFMIMDAG